MAVEESALLGSSEPRASVLMSGVTTFLNPYSYLLLRRMRPQYLRGDFFKFGYDGTSLALAAKVVIDGSVRRTSFDDTSIAPFVFNACVDQSMTVALVGSAPGVAEAAAALISQRYPGIQICLIEDGYFDSSRRGEVLARASGCNVVVCSMGTPHQEDFFVELSALGWQGVGFTCGGYLDQLVDADGGLYYPKWMDRCNLRWLYRIWREPRRLIRRYVVDYPIGISVFILDGLRAK